MMDEHKQAISFANSYFALVDGLASGLENHFAEDVVLDWFGRTIRGRRNVTAFMEAHKVKSRHIFSSIAPVTGIGYKKKRANRKKFLSYQNQIAQCKDIDSDKTIARTNTESFFHETKMFTMENENGKDYNQNDIDGKGIVVCEDMSYDLNEGDLSNLFKLEITSTSIEEIERSINRIKLEEEMAPTIKAIKRECGQGDGPVVVETSTIKYVEADGEIEFSRKFWKQDAWEAYHSAMSNVHTWRRRCKLQMAYSILSGCQTPELPRKSEKLASRSPPKSRLPSLEEINEMSGRLIPNTNKFGGFLKPLDFRRDRNGFLESLENEMAHGDSQASLLSPFYVKDQLVFKRPSIDDCCQKEFRFNYQIHVIIYESSNKCRMNLLNEFEKTKV